MFKEIRAIIFDMDGVLVDSEKQHINVEIATFREYGISITQEIAKEYFGTTVRDYIAAIGERFGMNWDSEELEEVISKHSKNLKKYYAEVFPLVPHVREVLEKLKLSGKYRIGLATSSSKENAEAVLSRHGVLDFFEERTFGDEVENGKPDPEIFLKTLEKLNENTLNFEEILPGNCVVIEDSGRGMQGAKTAGMKVIARKAGHNAHYDFKDADFIIEDLYDLEEILKII